MFQTKYKTGTGNTIVNKASKSFCLHTAYIPMVGVEVWRKMKICNIAYSNKCYAAK